MTFAKSLGRQWARFFQSFVVAAPCRVRTPPQGLARPDSSALGRRLDRLLAQQRGGLVAARDQLLVQLLEVGLAVLLDLVQLAHGVLRA